MQSRRLARSTEFRVRGEVEEGRGDSTLGSDSEHTAPTLHPGSSRSLAKGSWRAQGPGMCEEAGEGCCFLAPTPPRFNAEHNESATACMQQLRVGFPSLPALCAGEGDARLNICAGVRQAITCQGGHDSCIDSELGAMPQRQAVAHYLDAPRISDRNINVHVSDADIARDAGPSLATYTGQGTFQRQRTGREHARCGAGRAVVPEGVKAAAAAAGARSERQRETQATEQENAEQVAGDGEVIGRGQDRERTGSMRPGLGEQQGARRRRKVRKMRLKRPVLAGSGCTALPATQVVRWFLASGRRDRGSLEGFVPGRGMETLCCKVGGGLCSGGNGRDPSCSRLLEESKETCRGLGRPVADDREGVIPGGPVSRMPVC